MEKQIISQGAEAIILRKGDKVLKQRIEKSYRIKQLDEKIRKLRTRSEGKLLERASKIIDAPKVLKVDEKSKEITSEFIEGDRLSDILEKFNEKKQKEILEKVGETISKLHNNDIIHGDLTPSNMILSNEKKIYFIDFGLGYISQKLEDKAVDLHLLREAIEATFAEHWKPLFDSVKKGYSKGYKDSKKVLERFTAVERRGRYKQGS